MDTVNKDKKERKVDFNLIADSGVADYSDGDIIVIDKLGVKPINENIKLDMILMVFCTKGRMQCDINEKTYMANAGDVIICLPNSYLSNYLISPRLRVAHHWLVLQRIAAKDKPHE